jgi:hypothetical protein
MHPTPATTPPPGYRTTPRFVLPDAQHVATAAAQHAQRDALDAELMRRLAERCAAP